MRVLITGITGFAGGHLVDFLGQKKSVEIYGLARRGGNPKKKIYACDIRRAQKLEEIICRIKPERIFHLAAQSSVPASWARPMETFEENLIGTVNLLEAVRKTRLFPLIQLAGSAQEYGVPSKKDGLIDESVPMKPLSPYAVSKVSQDLLASQYIAHFGMKIVRTRAFNHIGPRQSAEFVTSSLARQIALIEAKRQKPEIIAGNLETVRDYTDVRDMARAYWLALENGRPGEVYNIASGKGYSARQILDIYLKLTPVKIKIRKDPALMRSSDLPRLVGDSRKFRRRTGWKTLIPFEKSLADILSFWRREIK